VKCRSDLLKAAVVSSTAAARILEVTSYPPPRAGWAVRVEFLKKRLEREGHRCVVLNTGVSRNIPSNEYETVMSGADFLRKVWRFSRNGFVVHAHANGDSVKGILLAFTAEVVNLACGRRPYLTFHAGAIQRYFPRDRDPRFVPLFWLLFAMAKKIICNSDAVKRCIAGYGVPEAKIVPIPAFSTQYLEFTPAVLPDFLECFLERYPTIVFTYVRLRPLFYPVVMVEGMARVMRARPDVGLVIVGGSGHADEGVGPAMDAVIERHAIRDRICFVDDLDHDAFLTVLQRAALYLRTPITDGVASSVLEALALRIPVVACDNGTRPAGVITYPAEDEVRLADAVDGVLAHRHDVVARLADISVVDTVSEEVALLTS
jgi:glycosyltransferase involved in cell wall biosynthesis